MVVKKTNGTGRDGVFRNANRHPSMVTYNPVFLSRSSKFYTFPLFLYSRTLVTLLALINPFRPPVNMSFSYVGMEPGSLQITFTFHFTQQYLLFIGRKRWQRSRKR